MSNPGIDVSLADFVEAFARLQPGEDFERAAIARLLGFDWQPPRPASMQSAIGSSSATPSPSTSGGPAPRPSTADGSAGPLPPQAAGEAPRRTLPSVLERLSTDRSPWRVGVAALPVGQSEENELRPPFDPLLEPRTSRAVVSGALATDSGEGPVDLDETVALLSRGATLTYLPRLAWPTLSRGVQLLIDLSKGLIPFARDQAYFEDALKLIVGGERMQTLWFAGCPTRAAGSGARDEWTDYRPPSPGTPVLVCTDLGIGRPPLAAEFAEPYEWLAFADVVRRAECPLVVLVPYPPSRWPKPLARSMLCLQWDRAIGAPRVRSVVGRAHQVRL